MSDSSICHLTTRQELVEAIPVWQNLWEQSGPESVFLGPHWLLTWWDLFGDGKVLSVVMVVEDREVVGFAPWYVEVHWGYRILRTMGHGFIDYEGVLAQQGKEALVMAALQRWLLANDFYDAVVFDRLLDDGWSADFGRWEQGKLSLQSYPSTISPFTDLSQGWDSVVDRFGHNLRSDTRRRLRRLGQQGNLRLRAVHTPEEFDVCFEKFLRWKRGRYEKRYRDAESVYGEGGLWGDARVAGYYRDVALKLMLRGYPALNCLDLDDEMVSAIFGMEKNGTYFYFAPAYCPDYDSYSIGRVHVWLLMQQICERGFHRFDFLIGDDGYKRKWATGVRHLIEVRWRKDGMLPWLRSLTPGMLDTLERQPWFRRTYGWLKARFRL